MQKREPTRSASTRAEPGIRCAVFGAFIALALASAANAGDSHAPRTPLLPKYERECGACHLAFPPGLLPATSWQSLMAGLPRHFGTDASLDAATAQELSVWLAANAGTYKKARQAPAQDRITRASWFVREHREVNAAVWRRPAVNSPANCAACHTTAVDGLFSEHAVRIPQ